MAKSNPNAIGARARELEASARALDPDHDARTAMFETVAAYAQGLADRLPEMPAYSAEPVPDPDRLAISETPGGMHEALAILDLLNRPGINQASGGHFAYIPGGGLLPSALADLVAAVGNRYSGEVDQLIDVLTMAATRLGRE